MSQELSKVELYQKSNDRKRQQMVLEKYRAKASMEDYATSTDIQLRELEISAIGKYLSGDVDALDLGCGNGYSIVRWAKMCSGRFTGIDICPELIHYAHMKASTEPFKDRVNFMLGNVLKLNFAAETFDVVISERCLFNLPSRNAQWQALKEIHRVLRRGGIYLMFEGTLDGLSRLNKVRSHVGLPPIPHISESNFFSLKFDEGELEGKLAPYFEIVAKEYFGTYYLISRVLHPLLVAPEPPQFDSQINLIARKIAEIIPDTGQLGHCVLYVLRKIIASEFR